MRKYNIKFVSLINSVIFIFSGLIILIGSAILLFPKGVEKNWAIIITVTDLVIAYFFWQKFVTGRTEWFIDGEGLTMHWTKQFAFHNNVSLNIKWAEIEKISKAWYDNNYYDLRIKLTSGKTIRFYHDNLTKKDDFKEFIKELYQTYNDKKKLQPI